MEGAAALFGRRSAASAWNALDLREAAYHPEPDAPAPPTAPRAPQPPGPFDAFYRTPRRTLRRPGRGGAVPDLLRPGGRAGSAQRRPPRPGRGAAAGGAGRPAALAANPDDAGAFLLLGEAYVRLASQPAEQSRQAALPPLGAERFAQAVAALEQAVLLRPDLDRAHALLAGLYFEDGQLDRALDHLLRPAADRRARGRGGRPGSGSGVRAAAGAAGRRGRDGSPGRSGPEGLRRATAEIKRIPQRFWTAPAWRPVTACRGRRSKCCWNRTPRSSASPACSCKWT